MTRKNIFAFFGLGLLVVASGVYFSNRQQDVPADENSTQEEATENALRNNANAPTQFSPQDENRNASNTAAPTQSSPQENTGTEATFAEMRKMFADRQFLKQPSQDVIAKFKAMGFQFTEKKSSNPHTGNRQILDLSAPHKGFTRLQIQYASDSSQEVLEGIRFTVEPHHFESFVNDIVGNASNLKTVQSNETGAVYETPDGYRLWLKVHSGANPDSQGESSNVMTGGFEPGVD